MAETPRHSVSVAAAIFDDSGENVLLIKRRDNGRWEPPGGVLELDETIEDGLRREVREETGADIEVGPLTGVYKNIPRAIIALVFRCQVTSGFKQETKEAAAVSWKPLARLSDWVSPVYAERVASAREGGRVSIRNHDGRRFVD